MRVGVPVSLSSTRISRATTRPTRLELSGMNSEIRCNGRTQIRLVGERPIEKQAITEMLDANDKGQSIKVSEGENGELVLTLEHV